MLSNEVLMYVIIERNNVDIFFVSPIFYYVLGEKFIFWSQEEWMEKISDQLVDDMAAEQGKT